MQLLAERCPVDAVVVFEAAILGHDHGALQMVRHAIERQPGLVHVERVSGCPGLGNAQPHERGAAGIDAAQQHGPGQDEPPEEKRADGGER